MELAMTQKYFSIMSRDLPETERCAARELLDASIGFREVATEAVIVGHIVNEMKSVGDQNIVRKRLGSTAYHVISIGQNDIELVNELFERLSTPAMIEKATLIRDTMIKLKDLRVPLSSGHV